jgi:hypothetical protein
MPKLDELEQEIYGRDEDDRLKKRMRRRVIFPGTLKKPPLFWGESPPRRVRSPSSFFSRKFVVGISLVFSAFIFLAAAGIFWYLLIEERGREGELRIEGRRSLEAGELATFSIVVKNTSAVPLKEGELLLTFPPGAIVREAGEERSAPLRAVKKFEDINPGEERIVETSLRLIGPEGEGQVMGAIFSYRPENLRARFTLRASKEVRIVRVPLSLSWEIPDVSARDREIEIALRYSSQASIGFNNLSLRLIYPSGFTFLSADPPPAGSDKTIWRLGTVAAGESGVIRIRGFMEGGEGESKILRAEVGIADDFTKEMKILADSSAETAIAISPLSLRVLLASPKSDFITPGDYLVFRVRWKNNTNVPIENVTIRVFPSGSILLLSTLEIKNGGVFDAGRESLVWGPGNVSSLQVVEPGEEGEFSFSLSTRERPVIRSAADRELVVRLRSTIEASHDRRPFEGGDISSENILSIKVRSLILFASKSLSRSSPLVSIGPVPPRPGEKTTYTVLWEIKSFTNDMKNIRVTTSLPPNVKWENAVSPKNAEISFDAASAGVRWSIGEIKAGTGVTRPTHTAAFQVSLIPGEPDVGKSILLTKESRLIALDSFTGEEREIVAEAVSTETREDSLTSNFDWIVAP